MKRSEINHCLRDAALMFQDYRFALPHWAKWSIKRWGNEPALAEYVREHQMGWDISDFGTGHFGQCGLVLFCLRNGIQKRAGEKPYAEKVMVIRENQVAPCHFHRVKMEDIINRGGGILMLEAWNALPDDQRDNASPVTVLQDGCRKTVEPGEPIELLPGDSLTVSRNLYHRFYGKAGHGSVLVGEVSQVNDDYTDNYFYEPLKRFAAIDEDEPALWPLWNEIPIREAVLSG